MSGERLQETALTGGGLLGDRAYALIDVATGKVASAKSVNRFPGLLDCRARFVEPPRSGQLPPVRIMLPDGQAVTSDAPDADRTLSMHFGREVRLARAAPEDYTIDQYHPDIEGADPAGHRDTVVEQKLGSAFFDAAGMPSPVPVGAFFDLFPVSVLTTSTLARLAELGPQTRFDERRFRMNVIVRSTEPGFLENDWIGCEVALGDTARLRVTKPDARCVMTTIAQDDLPHDPAVLRTLVQHNRLPGASGLYPCAGVYAVVGNAGMLRIGDRVMLA